MASQHRIQSSKQSKVQHEHNPKQSLSNPTATRAPTPQPLHSLLLVTRTRSGPQLALYYPPTFPNDHPYFSRKDSNDSFDESARSESEEYSSSSASESEAGEQEPNERTKRVQSLSSRQRPSLRNQRQYSSTSKNRATINKDDLNNEALLTSTRQNSQSSYGQKLNGIEATARGRDQPSLLATLPPYTSSSSGSQEDNIANLSGTIGGAGRLSRTSSATRFKYKYNQDHEVESKHNTTGSGYSSIVDGPSSRPQTTPSSTSQTSPHTSKNLHVIDSRDYDERAATPFSSQQKAESLAKLLAPSTRTWHKRRFEIGVEDVTFLGCPVFERKDGGWRSKKPGGRNRATKGADERSGESKQQQQHQVEDDEESLGESTADEKDSHSGNRHQIDEDGSGSDNENIETDTKSSPLPLSETSAAASDAQNGLTVDPGTSIPSASSFQSSTPGNDDGTLDSNSSTAPESLTMFHLVFVVVPPSDAPGEHQSTLQTIYRYVAKPLTKALTYAQKKNNFVWSEARLIAHILASANVESPDNGSGRRGGSKSGNISSVPSDFSYANLWETIASKSELARALATTYESITSGNIAHLILGKGIAPSLQIPQPLSTPFVVAPLSPQFKGLRPSTYDPTEAVGVDVRGKNVQKRSMIGLHSSVLLLQDSEQLLSHGLDKLPRGNRELLMSLTFFIRHCTPTKTLLQLSKKLNMSLHYARVLSMHLIKYRLAIAIPPLHPSNTYVVSPNADFTALPAANRVFSKRFAMLPSLVTILGKLSTPRSSSSAGQGPQPWGALIPSSDHKTSYMEILEWMLRGGWIMQLRTFCWVRISADIKASVAKIMRQEEEEAAAEEAAAALVSEEDIDNDNLSEAIEMDGKSPGGSLAGDSVVAATVVSPRLKPHLYPPGPPRPPSEAGSTSTARTAVRVSSLRFSTGNPRAPASALNTSTGTVHEHRVSDGSVEPKVSLDEARPPRDERPEIRVSDFESSIIVSPSKANAVESRWLKYIASTLPEGELRSAWPTLVKYFDGKHAVEEIAMNEGWRRKVTTPILTKLIRDYKILLTVRHW